LTRKKILVERVARFLSGAYAWTFTLKFTERVIGVIELDVQIDVRVKCAIPDAFC
jgi:hypothetical protein